MIAKFNQTATVWRKNGKMTSYTGLYVYRPPESIKVVWQENLQVINKDSISELTSTIVVYTKAIIYTDSFLKLGFDENITTIEPINVEGAYRVLKATWVNSIVSSCRIFKVYL